MKLWIITVLRLMYVVFFGITSLYCLLAFLPYTYLFLVKAPPYEWMIWFAREHAWLYWGALVAALGAHWDSRQARWFRPFFGVMFLAGCFITARSFMPRLQNDWTAYLLAVAALFPVLFLSFAEIAHCRYSAEGDKRLSQLPYANGVGVSVLVALVYVGATLIRSYGQDNQLVLGARQAELTILSLVSHVLLALLLVSLLNLIGTMAGRASRPVTVRRWLIGVISWGALVVMIAGYLSNAFSFHGWTAILYACLLAGMLTAVAFATTLPLLTRPEDPASRSNSRVAALIIVAAMLVALNMPSVIGTDDWDGFLQYSFTLAFWITVAVCAYRVRPSRAHYSAAAILAVLVICGVAYKGLQSSAFLWARSLGTTDDEVRLSLESYAQQDASFSMTRALLSSHAGENCADLCRIMRENTNLANVRLARDLKLVDDLHPAQGPRPNIFVVIVDSLRPDYLGAYNPAVDFTPNLDAFARDSIVMRNAFTQYAGTSLSEPAIWSGTEMLHSHYVQPFARVNNLERLAKTDGYQLVVSYDEVLRQILPPEDDAVKLDRDQVVWKRLEACSTFNQLEKFMNGRPNQQQPVFFYAQPKNVHQFAVNDLPGPEKSGWKPRPGFNNRIAFRVSQVDGCLGNLFTYLKQHNLYDSSIVVVSSDHGDATQGSERSGHAIFLWPEIMRIPMLVHLPAELRAKVVDDPDELAAATDIVPSLYYLLGHGPLQSQPEFGHSLFAGTRDELESHRRQELFMASDVRAAYGILDGAGRYFYVAYDSPPHSLYFDLRTDPQAQHNLVNDEVRKRYDQEIIRDLRAVADLYGYRPGIDLFDPRLNHQDAVAGAGRK